MTKEKGVEDTFPLGLMGYFYMYWFTVRSSRPYTYSFSCPNIELLPTLWRDVNLHSATMWTCLMKLAAGNLWVVQEKEEAGLRIFLQISQFIRKKCLIFDNNPNSHQVWPIMVVKLMESALCCQYQEKKFPSIMLEERSNYLPISSIKMMLPNC